LKKKGLWGKGTDDKSTPSGSGKGAWSKRLGGGGGNGIPLGEGGKGSDLSLRREAQKEEERRPIIDWPRLKEVGTRI